MKSILGTCCCTEPYNTCHIIYDCTKPFAQQSISALVLVLMCYHRFVHNGPGHMMSLEAVWQLDRHIVLLSRQCLVVHGLPCHHVVSSCVLYFLQRL